MDFRRIRNREDLAKYLGIAPDRLDWLIAARTNDVFEQHWLPKKARGWREVWEVRDVEVSDFYKSLSRLLYLHFQTAVAGYPHPSAHGYVRGRSTLTNAKRHVGAHNLLKADIRSFFRNITNSKVRAALQSSGIRDGVLDDFLGLLVWEDHTPLGLPTSPVLVNAVALPLDQALEGLAPGGRYTRYSDDLTFSGSSLPSIELVANVVADHGFEVSLEKSHYASRGRGLYVTGLCLESGQRPHVPKKLKKKVRQELYYAAKHGLREHAGRKNYRSVESAANKLNGTVQYIRGIDRNLGDTFQDLVGDVLAKAGFSSEIAGATVNRGGEVQFLFDESTPHGTNAQVLCLTVVEDEQLVGSALAEFLDDLRAEPGALNVDVLDESGLHWAEIHFDHKTKAVERLRLLPFRSFVAYRQDQSSGYRQTYEELFSRLIRDRLKKHHGQKIRVLVEENSNLRLEHLRQILHNAFDEVDRHSPRARVDVPIPSLEFFKKNSVATAPLPDLVLGEA